MTPATKWTQEDYDRAAAEYLAKLPPEHFMEATPSAMQRMITLASLMVIKSLVSGLHVYNELLVQFFFRGQLRQVVPDNMIVRGALEERKRTSYAADEEGVPFWVLEYVSRSSQRKDYVENHRTYEQELRVPYYLLFYPEEQDLRLYHLAGRRYAQVGPTPEGRLAIPELEVEIGLVDSWVRFWFRGEQVALPDELHHRADHYRRQLQIAERALQQRDREIEGLDEQIQQRDQQIQQRDQQIQQRDQQIDTVLVTLRPLVESRARSAGRQDILNQLPTTTDAAQLSRWLADLA